MNLLLQSSSSHRRLVSFTKQLTSHVNQARHDQALNLFRYMQPSLPLDPSVFPLVLKSCAALCRPHLGSAIHAHTAKSSLLSNPFVACALIDMYGKCLSLSSARKLFDEISERNVVAWNAMISLYTHSGHVQDAFELFEHMDVAPTETSFNAMIDGLSRSEDERFRAIEFYRKMEKSGLRPNFFTLLALLPACVSTAALNLIKEIHGYAIRSRIDSEIQLRSVLIEAYGRCGCLLYAQNVFDSMSVKDVVAWSSLISAYALHGEARLALETFKEMELAKVKPDGVTFLGVLKACTHAGLADEALSYVDRMQKDYGTQPSSDHYSCLVDCLSRVGKLSEACKVIREMPVNATAKAWGAILGACRTYEEMELAEIAEKALSEIEPQNAANYLLGRIYSSSGRYEEAERMRKEMKERGVKSAPGSSWIVNQV